jgi:uncharacterized protein YcfL
MKHYIIAVIVSLGLFGCSAHKTATIDTTPELTTRKSSKSIDARNILYLVDGMETSKEAIELIDPSTIEKIEVVKTKDEIIKYTDADYDGIVAIYIKKKQ